MAMVAVDKEVSSGKPQLVSLFEQNTVIEPGKLSLKEVNQSTSQTVKYASSRALICPIKCIGLNVVVFDVSDEGQ